MTSLFLATYAVSLALPLILLRGRRIASWYSIEVVLGAVAYLSSRQVAFADLYFAASAFAAVRLAAFSIVAMSAREQEVRWSANRAAAAALLVYAVAIPAMLRTPIDGDEPYYLLVTESIVRDGDLDLSNQYRELATSESGRTDLKPQTGDPSGPGGAIFSRHPPFLPLLLAPGYLLAGLHGALAIMALFGALLVRATMRLLEDERIGIPAQRLVFPFLAFGPPLLFYATRIWPEVPAAYFFVEALRGVRDRRLQKWLPFSALLVLLKLRFVLIAVPLAALAFVRDRRRTARGASSSLWIMRGAVGVALLAVPMAIVWFIHGNPLNVHAARELLPWAPKLYVIGALGLLLDGAGGLLYQAPFFLLGIFGLTRWRTMPESFRLGSFAACLYLFYLVPRSEWHGGWSPPLRYIVIFIPVLALGAAVLLEKRGARAWLPLIGIWTTTVVAHAVAYPWRLFQVANGENWAGEAMSRLFAADASRLFPSFIRLNDAAVVAGVILVLALVAGAFVRIAMRMEIIAALAAAVIALGGYYVMQPARVVNFEDAHVDKTGGTLFPEIYTVARFRFRGGWILREGDALSFLAKGGQATLEYSSEIPAMIEIGGQALDLPVSSGGYHSVPVSIPRDGRVELRCLSGTVNLDRLTHD